MKLALSTHWNTQAHQSGESLIDEILELGFSSVELGYDLTVDLVPGIKKRISEKCVSICSVHNYCPVPMGVPHGHPELFLMSSPDEHERTAAVNYIRKTLDFANEMGAEAVVVHPGRVDMSHLTPKLITMAEEGKRYDERYEKLKIKLLMQREKKVRRSMENLYQCIEEILSGIKVPGAKLALENLPSWEAIPSEQEMQRLIEHFDHPALRYWHDIGHAQVRQNLGFSGHIAWLKKLAPSTVGMHIHDVIPPAQDHIMPPNGEIDFETLKPFVKSDTIFVLEPASNTPAEDIRKGAEFIQKVWGID